VTDSLIR